MRPRIAQSLRRLAHRIEPDSIKSVEIKWSQGEPTYVDIQLRWGQRVAGYVDSGIRTNA